ncbi:MAG: CHAT domain-containing protein [Brachymonas sp.]|nr:CHAT domain-containing protein [Brachymonas sp.]
MHRYCTAFVFSFLPFQALTTSSASGKKWWIEEREISYTLSASVMAAQSGINLPIPPSLSNILALGNPDVNDSKLDLPGSQAEVENLKTLYNSTQVHIRKEASRQRVLEQASSAGVLHLAAHAFVDELDPKHSYVLLANPTANSGRAGGQLEVGDFRSLRLSKTSLVALSACNSGIGRVARGDEFAGFKSAVMMAGAPRMLVSLWPVNDEATAQLMNEFYKSVAKDTSSQALREAQLSLIRRPEFSSPFMWAAFVLVGQPN